MAVAPHSLAAQSALDVLREGRERSRSNDRGRGDDGGRVPAHEFDRWRLFLARRCAGKPPGAIEACGSSAARASIDGIAEGFRDHIPDRGGRAANTVAGAVSGWGIAHMLSKRALGGRMPLTRLLSDAIYYARHGVPVTLSQAAMTAKKAGELKVQPGFSKTFLQRGKVPRTGELFVQPRLATTLERIARAGTGMIPIVAISPS